MWMDPLITVLVGIYIISHTWGVVKETVDILMQSTPIGIDVNAIKEKVEVSDNVDNIHHLHVWKMNDIETHLEAHVNLNKNIDMVNMMIIKSSIESLLKKEFGINHITLQMGYNCCNNDENLIHHNS